MGETNNFVCVWGGGGEARAPLPRPPVATPLVRKYSVNFHGDLKTLFMIHTTFKLLENYTQDDRTKLNLQLSRKK